MKFSNKNTAVILIAVFFIFCILLFFKQKTDSSINKNRIDNLNTLKEYILEFKQKYNRYPPQIIKRNTEITIPFVNTLNLKGKDNSDIYRYYYYQGGFALCAEMKDKAVYNAGNFTCEEIERTFI